MFVMSFEIFSFMVLKVLTVSKSFSLATVLVLGERQKKKSFKVRLNRYQIYN